MSLRIEATVYALRDVDGNYLYVGCSNYPLGRIGAHQRKEWWIDVARIDLLNFDDRRDALEYERDLIFRVAPAHNKTHAPETVTPAEMGLSR